MNPDNQLRDQKPSINPLILGRDLISVAILGFLLLYVHYFGEPFIRGFHCDDETIRYPYKESTVSSGVCYFVGSGINLILILLLEYRSAFNQVNAPGQNRDSHGQFHLRFYVRNIYCRLLVWFFGAIISELLTDIGKFSAGRLRPHFISVCNPTIGARGVSLDEFCLTSENQHRYITDYNCSLNHGWSYRKQIDSRLSFPSGHSSYSAFSAAYAVLYIQEMVDSTEFGLFKPAFQVLIVAAAFYTGLTRISDYKHHWQDVLAGFSLGFLVASILTLFVWPSFFRACSKSSKSEDRARGRTAGEELGQMSY